MKRILYLGVFLILISSLSFAAYNSGYLSISEETLETEYQKRFTISWNNSAVSSFEYCITTSSEIVGDEEWLAVNGSYVDIACQARYGERYLHIRQTNSSGTWYDMKDITYYTAWTGNDNYYNYKTDNCTISYANGNITIKGYIYTNVQGEHRISALGKYKDFIIEGESVYTGGSYDPNGECSCIIHDEDGYGIDGWNYNGNYCEIEWYYMDDGYYVDAWETGETCYMLPDEYHGYESCNHVPYGWKYNFEFVIDAKTADISEGQLDSITLTIAKKDYKNEYITMGTSNLTCSLNIDIKGPTVTITTNSGTTSGGVYSKLLYATIKDDGVGLKNTISYAWVDEKVNMEDATFSSAYIYTKSGGTTKISAGADIGYIKLTCPTTENGNMKYRLWIKVYDTSGNLTLYEKIYDCSAYKLKITYINENTNEIIGEETKGTRLTSYALKTEVVKEFNGVNYNRSEKSTYATAVYEKTGGNALASISGDTCKITNTSSYPTVNVTLYYKPISYSLQDIEEGVVLTNLNAVDSKRNNDEITWQDFWPIGLYDGRYYWGFQYGYEYYNNGTVWGRYIGLAYYDVATSNMKFVKLENLWEVTNEVNTATGSLTAKMTTGNYKYAKAIQIAKTDNIQTDMSILLEDGIMYYFQEPNSDWDYKIYYPKKTNIKELLDIEFEDDEDVLALGVTTGGSLVGWSDESSCTIASNYKAASRTYGNSANREYIAVLTKDGTLYNKYYKKVDGTYTLISDVIAENVVELRNTYFVKDIGNNQWSICRIKSTSGTYDTLVTLTANSFTLENLSGKYLLLNNGYLYNLETSSTAKSYITTGVELLKIYTRTYSEEYDVGYVVKTNGDVYKVYGSSLTKVTGLTNIQNLEMYETTFYASDASDNIYTWEAGGYNTTAPSSSDITTVSGIKGQVKEVAPNDGWLGNFILLDNGDLYRYGTHITDFEEKYSVSGEYFRGHAPITGDTGVELLKSNVNDIYLITQEDSDIINSELTVLLNDGTVWRIGFNFDGDTKENDTPTHSSYWDLELKQIDLVKQYSGPIWVDYTFRPATSGDTVLLGTYNYSRNLVRQNAYHGSSNYDRNELANLPYSYVYDKIPSKELVKKEVLYNNIKVTKDFIQRADIGKVLNIAANDILVRSDGKLGVIVYDGSVYKVVWFNIKKEDASDISFRTDEYKTVQKGMVHLEFAMSETTNVDEVVNNISENITVKDINGNVVSNVMKIPFGIVLNSSTGLYDFKVAIGGESCFTQTTSTTSKYKILLDLVTSGAAKIIEKTIVNGAITKSNEYNSGVVNTNGQKIEANVEVIPLLNLV